MGVLVITHYQRVLNYIKPNFVHVFFDGRIVAEGGPELADSSRPRATRPSSRSWKRRQHERTEDTRPRSSPRSAPTTSTASTTTEDYFFKSGRGLSREVVEAISEHKDEPEWMRKFRLKALDYFMARPMPSWGGDLSGIDFDNIYYYIRPTEKQAKSWDDVPPDIKNTFDRLGIPEAERKFLAGVGAQYESRGRLPQAPGGSREEGRDLPRHGLGPARARGPRQAVLRHDHPAERQQVRRAELGGLVGRLVHLRAAGRQDRDAAPGLLPDQRREHGPVRAHADHRRRGRLRALRRGLHGADLLDRLAALGGGRDHRQAGRRAAATRRSRTGRRTSTTSSPSAPSPTRTRRWSGSTATSARS